MATKFNRQSLAPRLIPVASSPKAEASLPFPATERARRISSRVLLGEASCLVIDHAGVAYILRSTRLGKLILTK